MDKERIINWYPILNEISSFIKKFRYIFDHGRIQSLHLFIEKYMQSNIKKLTKFSKSFLTDLNAIENAVGGSLSNAFDEGNNNRLKMIKLALYDRANFPLLRARSYAETILEYSNSSPPRNNHNFKLWLSLCHDYLDILFFMYLKLNYRNIIEKLLFLKAIKKQLNIII